MYKFFVCAGCVILLLLLPACASPQTPSLDPFQSVTSMTPALTTTALLSPATPTASDPVTHATITSDPGYIFLRQYGWSPQGKPKDDVFENPRPIPKTPPIYLPLTASQAVGLDFSKYAGQRLVMRKYYLGHLAYPGANPNINIVNAFILFDHQQVVGARITGGGVPGVHAVNEQIPVAPD